MFEKNRYLWGILAGILYFAVLIAAGAAIFKTFKFESSMIINGIICMTSGMVGGMISHNSDGRILPAEIMGLLQ